MTRFYILSDNYVLSSSCMASSLTRGRVCNLQCNHASSVSSYIATDSQSASSSWYRAPCWAHDQILISLFDNYFKVSSCRAPSSISPINRVVQPKVEVKSQSHVSAGRNFQCYHWDACSATWNLGTNSAFALGRRKTTENLDRVGRSQDLPDAD
jgi:hypothetical protein